MLRLHLGNFFVFLFLLLLSCEQSELEEEIDPCSITSIQVTSNTIKDPDYASNNGIIEIAASGSDIAQYQFSLNDTLYQNINQFTDLAAGDYTIYVRDGNNCKTNISISLQENPAILILSPNEGEEVTTPFEITYQIFNFGEISEKGNKITFYVDDIFASDIYDTSKYTIEEMEEGNHKIKLALVENGNESVFADSINIKVAPSFYKVNVIGGVGSGEYKSGEWVQVKADLPQQTKIFTHWIGDVDFLIDSKKSTVNFIMPPQNITLEASYEALSYNNHIKPLIKNKCVACHGVGATDDVDISTYQLQKKFAQDIKRTIEECSMPPQNECLSDAEIHAIVSWIDLGMPNN